MCLIEIFSQLGLVENENFIVDFSGHDSMGVDLAGLDSVGLDSAGLDSAGLDSASLDSAGFDLADLGFEIYHINSIADPDTFQIFSSWWEPPSVITRPEGGEGGISNIPWEFSGCIKFLHGGNVIIIFTNFYPSPFLFHI